MEQTEDCGMRLTSGLFNLLRRSASLGIALLMCGQTVIARDFQIAPAAAWVASRQVDLVTQATPSQTLNGVHYILVDQQTQLAPTGRSTFLRIVRQALDVRGVESVAHIRVDFDPTYQSLVLHTLNVHRSGQVQDRLHSSVKRVLQRETELEYRIYDGSKTVDLTLSDVRPNDIVEYSYSVKGTNPDLVGKESGFMEMQWRAPVQNLYRRLIAPADLVLTFRSHLGPFEPQITSQKGWTEYSWSSTSVLPISLPDNTPSWYNAYPYVAWTAFPDWASVARWAEPLYAVPKVLSLPLQKEIDRIATTQTESQKRLALVLDFVQSQIRYLGIEIGQGTFRPRSPSMVFQNRYGDCKDKVLLMVTMLGVLGIEASPALVNTERRHVIGDYLPSPTVFNHVIVKAEIDGKNYWLDPTRSPQKGGIQQVAQANFGKALVLDGVTRDLSTIPVTTTSEYRRSVHMKLDASKGYNQPAAMTVTTIYDGVSADTMRGNLRRGSLDEFQRKYLNFYTPYFPDTEVVAQLSVDDDETMNLLVVKEHYKVPTLLTKTSSGGKPKVYLYAPDMEEVLRRPEDTVRSAPLALRHPENIKVTIEAVLPEDESITNSKNQIRDAVFDFEEETNYSERALQLSYRYQSRADHVKPENMQTYIANLSAARKEVGYTLGGKVPRAPLDASTWIALVVALLLVLNAVGWVIAVGSVFLSWHALPPVKKRADWVLLAGGICLLLLPFFQSVLLAFAATSGVMDQPRPVGMNFARAIQAGAIGFLFLITACFFWYQAWGKHWLQWAMPRTRETEQLLTAAKRCRLPHQWPLKQAESVVRTGPPPGRVLVAVRMLWLSLLLSIFGMYFSPEALNGGTLTAGLVVIAWLAYLGWRIYRGRNWARIVLALLVAVDLMEMPFLQYSANGMSGMIALKGVGLMLQIFALYLVFTTPGSDWFERGALEVKDVDLGIS